MRPQWNRYVCGRAIGNSYIHCQAVGKYPLSAFLLFIWIYNCVFSPRRSVSGMAREPLDIYGYNTTSQLEAALKRTKTSKMISFTL